jgi:transposase
MVHRRVRIKRDFALFLLCEASHKRKNYLHVGSDAGGHTAAVMYTLLGTARLNGINPQRYLRHVLERIAEHPSNRIDELLPWVVAAKWADETNAQGLPMAA